MKQLILFLVFLFGVILGAIGGRESAQPRFIYTFIYTPQRQMDQVTLFGPNATELEAKRLDELVFRNKTKVDRLMTIASQMDTASLLIWKLP